MSLRSKKLQTTNQILTKNVRQFSISSHFSTTDFPQETKQPTVGTPGSAQVLRVQFRKKMPVNSGVMAIHTCEALRAYRPPLFNSSNSTAQRSRNCRFSVQNCMIDPNNSRKLVLDVKDKLEKEHYSLPVGKNGRDDEDMILWFLKDRRYSVEEAVAKLTKAIRWRQEFGVSDLSEDAVKSVAETGKAYVHDFLDVNDRPVLIVVASKHLPAVHDPLENEKLCVFFIEKALSKLPAGKEKILGIFDFRGFGTENIDLSFLTFLFDVFYYYYPKRLGEVLFVEAPLVFKPIWQLTKPLLKSYASLVKFCSVETVRKEYFTDETIPANFRN